MTDKRLLPLALRAFLARQVPRHLSGAEVKAPPKTLTLLRLLHMDACLPCAHRRGQALAATAEQKGGT